MNWTTTSSCTERFVFGQKGHVLMNAWVKSFTLDLEQSHMWYFRFAPSSQRLCLQDDWFSRLIGWKGSDYLEAHLMCKVLHWLPNMEEARERISVSVISIHTSFKEAGSVSCPSWLVPLLLLQGVSSLYPRPWPVRSSSGWISLFLVPGRSGGVQTEVGIRTRESAAVWWSETWHIKP